MGTHRATVKTHTRTSKNGKTHTVHQHARKTTFTEHLKTAYNTNLSGTTRQRAANTAVAIAASTLTILALQTIISITAAILITATLLCISLISLAATGKMAKPGKWFPSFFKSLRGPLSPKRRAKHWYKKTGRKIKKRVIPQWLHR